MVKNEIDELDAADRKILDIAQSSFPLCRRPYLEIGKACGMSENEAWERISRMRKSGLIRRLGANFQSAGLGCVSTLCAAKVPTDKLEEFIETVNAVPGVTHNYERAHVWNIWFTLIGKNRQEVEDILERLRKETGIEILDLPATRLFKIRVDFQMQD